MDVFAAGTSRGSIGSVLEVDDSSNAESDSSLSRPCRTLLDGEIVNQTVTQSELIVKVHLSARKIAGEVMRGDEVGIVELRRGSNFNCVLVFGR